MTDIHLIDRESKKKIVEKVPCQGALEFLYSKNPFAWFVRTPLCRLSLFSKLFGYLQKRHKSRKNILPFIEKYHMDASEFLDPVECFASFNDFFIRKLKSEARPFSQTNAILPADGRYLAFQDISKEDGFLIKGKKFSLETLLGDVEIARKYAQGSMVLIRLAPVDYHRFHFPCDCTPSSAQLINGPLFSVNPIALKTNIDILADNKRMITNLETTHFGTVPFIEVGATNVGSIIQTYEPNKFYKKGEEKGYFSFGGSSAILLFEPGKIKIDQDLIENTQKGFETLGRLGQSLGF